MEKTKVSKFVVEKTDQTSRSDLVNKTDEHDYNKCGAVCIRQVHTQTEAEQVGVEIEFGLLKKNESLNVCNERNKRVRDLFAYLSHLWQRYDRHTEIIKFSALTKNCVDSIKLNKFNILFDQAFAKEPGIVEPVSTIHRPRGDPVCFAKNDGLYHPNAISTSMMFCDTFISG
jgi:hypothetical protein